LATRHHGLVGGERGRGDKRRPLLRNLAHTSGPTHFSSRWR
jgi:hypothetical protein